ncbi:MAG: dihydrofolate reductase [Pseudomonadota bacterium]|jgi:dihydrofolate reductase
MTAGASDATVALVVAVAENGVIGRDGGLPWRLSSDLKAFRRLTMGKPVVMGRKTYQSIGRPLDGRDNIVVTRDTGFAAEGAIVVASIAAALEEGRRCAQARGVDEIMVIGGAEVYRATMDCAGRIYWTEVHAAPEGDTFMGRPDPAHWQEVSRSTLAKGEKDDYACSFIVYERCQADRPDP